MESSFKKVRLAARSLAGSPIVTAAALVSLSLGIGATTAIFTLLHAVLLRDLPIADPESVVALFTVGEKEFDDYMLVSHPNFEDLRDRCEAFTELVDVVSARVALSGEGGPERVRADLVDGDYFGMLGVAPSRGRAFAADSPEIVLSHAFWQRRFGADGGVLGRKVVLNDRPFTVVGVAPRGFKGLFTLDHPDLWAPMDQREALAISPPARLLERRGVAITSVYGRLRPGVSLPEARAEVRAVGRSLAEQYPDVNRDRRLAVLPISEAAIYPSERVTYVKSAGVLVGAAGTILAITCFNVAHLLLGRAMARRREIAIRRALGATAGRIFRQLFGESLLLALAAAALGLVLARWARAVLWAWRPPSLHASEVDLTFDAEVLSFALALSLATGLLFGLAPALRAARREVVSDLRGESEEVRGEGRPLTLKNLLVVAQVAFAFVALIGAGLFVASLRQALEVDPGFEPRGLATMRFDLGLKLYEPERVDRFLDRAVETARGVAGVESATLATQLPLAAGGFLLAVLVEGRDPDAPDNALPTPVNAVEAGYFDTLGIRLLRGRDFAPSDRRGGSPVAIVNTAMAEALWPDRSPLGERFRFDGLEVVREVVGLVETTRLLSLGEEPQPQVYLPRRQTPNTAYALAIRASSEPLSLLTTVRREIQRLDPGLPITDVGTVEASVSEALWGPRMGASLLGAAGLLALFLASVGIFGVTSYSVKRRRHEIGVRMAVGARGAVVLRLILGQTMVLVGLGLALGLAAALVAGRRIASLLIGVGPADPLVLGTTAAVLAAVAAAATLLPAWQATRVDPVRVLRNER